MNRPPRFTRRLFTLTLESDSDLHYIAERIGMTYSEAVRLGLRLAAERLRSNPPQVVKTLIPEAPQEGQP